MMADFTSSGGGCQTSLLFEKEETTFNSDIDDLTTPTAAPSRSLDSIDAPLNTVEHQVAEVASDSNFHDEAVLIPPQTSDVFHRSASNSMSKTATKDVSIAPTYPSHGALGRFDSDYGDDGSQDDDSSDGHDDGAAEAFSSLYTTEVSESRRRSENVGSYMPQSFRPFQSRNSDDFMNATTNNDMETAVSEEDANNIFSAPQCRHTPSIITSSEASYIFQQLDDLRIAPSGITYNKPKYLKPSEINGNKFADLLSIDALHAISSYCDEKSWMALCHTSKQWRRVGFEVFRKVRMHAFRCAGEVVLAWARGEHADARQLAALYIKNGVPIYPSPLGHAYRTLAWKMELEIEAKQGDSDDDNKTDSKDDEVTDRFYMSRHQSQDEDADISTSTMLTYVEEKCTYWKNEKGIQTGDMTRTPDILSSFAHPMVGDVNHDGVSSPRALRRNSFSALDASLDQNSISTTKTNIPKMTLRVHRHLADQHFFGATSINDEGGDMDGVDCDLNADFFHPQWKRKKCNETSTQFSHLFGRGRQHYWFRQQQRWSMNDGDAMDNFQLNLSATAFETALEDMRRMLAVDAPMMSSESRNDLRRGSSFLRHDSLPPLSSNSSQDNISINWHHSPASDVQLEIYSLSSSKMSTDNTKEDRRLSEIISQVSRRCTRYQLKLESFLGNFDMYGFDECLLDFWDEVFPLSKGIHFYNSQAAVPRMSSLQQFMTTPLPKAIGVMQCEIVRVKKNIKGLGKGRLFPAYEYRLFIRDTSSSGRDSVLLVAKSKNGRKNVGPVDNTDAVTNTSNSKRGMNNYYLHLPQKIDVDMHYENASGQVRHSQCGNSGMSVCPAAAKSKVPIQLGRLQSNFIGTEFQVFSEPKIVMKNADEEIWKNNRRSSSSEESDRPEHGDQIHPAPETLNLPVATPIHSSERRRGSSLVKLARRASNGLSRRGRVSKENDTDDGRRKKTLTRRVSWSSSRPSRRAIANNSDIKGLPLSAKQPVMIEEENGAITYTANLLGNRPRIMDVCIPKVNDDGTVSESWKDIPDNSSNSHECDNCQMLNRFKAIQQEREDQEADDTNLSHNSDRNHGLAVFQNRPPWWNVELGAFVLNFGGRVSVASVKNFQLCERRDQDHIMQFGRIQGRHNFTMDFQHPLTPAQAFAIAISSLQSKISFG